MDLRSNVVLSSSWQASADLHCALYISSNSGILLDHPFASEQELSLLLTQPPGGDHCLLHMDTHRLRGYCLSAVGLTSSSRTVELYSEDEYIRTARGAFVRNTESGFELYNCHLELPTEEFYRKLSLKLLSLKGRTEVLVDKLELTVTEDYGGTMTSAPGLSAQHPQPNVQRLLESLPTHNLPPFMQGLVSSLQHLSLRSQGPPMGSAHAMPAELSELSTVLRRLRPPPSAPVPVETTECSEQDIAENTVDNDGDTAANNHVGLQSQSEVVSELERRLQKYIDEKFVELQRQIDERFEELTRTVSEKLNSPSHV